MSGNLGPQASTKGETTSKTTSKTGYDRLDINKLYKGKTAEPVAKTVTQKHGMQTLGKAPPARRAGASLVKPETTSNDNSNSSVPPQQPQQTPSSNLGQPLQPHPKWSNTSHPPGPPSPLNVPNVSSTGQPIHERMKEKNWSGGPDVGGNYQSQRFAQEFPSLDAGSEPTRGSLVNSNQQAPLGSGLQASSKSHDNQYGPGPILRPQTEGSWNQGGGRGMTRPPGPSGPNAPVRDPGPERPNLGGPTPPPMSLGQGGPAPPPLGAYPMQYRGMPPFMYQNSGPPGPGYYPPGGPGMPRYGMPVPPGAPPPSGPRDDGHRDSNRNRGPPPPLRPTQQFAVKPIIRQEDMRRMDDIDQEGTWSSVRDDVDYNKRISFSDDESEERRERDPKRSSERKSEKDRPDVERVDRKPVRILERQPSTNEREPQSRDQDKRYDHANKEHAGYDQDNEDEWNKRRPNAPYDINDRDRGVRRGRDPRDDDWRSNNSNRFEDDGRNKKGPGPGPGPGPNVRVDPRGPPDFANKQFSNLPPRLLRQQQQQNIQSSFAGNQRESPSPVSAQLAGKDREKDFQRDRDWDRERDRTQPTTQYRILERNRGDSESSNTSIRDKRGGNNEFDSRSYAKEQSSRSNSESQREKNKESESPKDKTDGNENRNDVKRSEDSKSSFRAKSGFTSSWADEVDEDDFEDVRKSVREPSIQAVKPEIKAEERTVPKRVYIQQRKVENMTTHKSEPQQEQKQLNEIPKQDKPAERPRSTAWGEREGRDKSRNDIENSSQLTEIVDATKIPEREIILSEKAQQLIHHNREDHTTDHFDKNQEDERYSNKDLDKKESKDRIERHEQEKGRDRFGHHKVDPRQQDRDRGNNFNRDRQQQRPGGRWGSTSNDFRRDNRTPEREFNASSGRSSATDNSSASFASSNKAPTESEAAPRVGVVGAVEKSRSGELLKEGSPIFEKDVSDGLSKEKLDLDRDENRQRDMDRRNSNRNSHDEGDSDSRGNYKSGRNREREPRERVGHAVYQPRGGWGRQDTRGKVRGGGRDQYDRPRRNDFDRDQDRVSSRDDRDLEIIKDKTAEEDSGPLNYETRKEGLVDDDGFKKEREGGAGEPNKKSKSPVTNKRNMRGGNRLQGYGPPSDKNPFSSASSNKDDDPVKEKQTDQNIKTNSAPSTGPVPLMELGDISPPNMPSRSRHGHGGRGRGGGMPPRMQEPYSFRGGNKRGRGDAKPLMSITSNDLERNEWESGSESGDDDSKKSQSVGSKAKKESNKAPGNEKYRQNQNIIRNPSTKDKSNIASSNIAELTNCPNNQDPAKNNKGKGALSGRSGTSNSDLDSYSSAIGGDVPQPGSTSDNSENVDGDGYQSQIQNKKNGQAKDKSNFSSSNKNIRNDKTAIKDRKIKNPPYEARPSTTKDIPPRFQKQQQGNQVQYSSKTSDGSNSSNKESQGQTNVWEKSVSSSTKLDQNSQGTTQSSLGLMVENKDSVDLKNSVTSITGVHTSGAISSTIMDSTGGPVKTMIFENRNYKSISNASKAPGSAKLGDSKNDSLTSGLDLPKDMPLTFGKGVGESSTDLDFDFEQSTTQSQTAQSVSSHHSSSKPTPIGQPSRSYSSHQPSPISPLAADLNEKIQSVKRVWDAPSMPSVAEQVGVCGSEDTSFHGGFGNDSFKATESSNRDFSSSLQQTQSGYAPGSSPALSAISKPDSSTSPNSASMRQVKPQQQSSMDNQSHGGMSSSPFAYSMPQQHQTNAFGGMSAVPSPPAVMYGTSQGLHGGHHTGVYQAFPHVEPSQVMNTTGRSQYGQQYSNPQGAAGSGPYGLTSMFMPSIDTGYQPMSSFPQHQQQHSQSGPQGQAPNQNSRISPGPMTTSGGGSTGGVMMNSSGMKNQGGSGAHPNMSHQQHQHQVLAGTHSQQGYSHNQMSHHHHSGAMTHHQHAVGPVGPAKAGNYSQGGIATQSQPQLFIPFDPNQQMNFGQNYISSGIRSAPPQGGPPPSATPPVQALQASSSYYSGNTGNQVYHGSNQPGNLQQLHVAVAPNPQALQNLQTATQQLGLQFQSPLNIQQYSQQAASTVSALNLGGQLVHRPGPPGHSHSYMKQPGLELVQQQSQQMKSHESMMNQAWNTQAFNLNQGFHGGNKPGGNTNSGNNIGSQRKGNHQMGSMGNMGGMKYMSNTGGGYPGQKGGRFSAPGPIQRPVSTSPSTGPPGSIISSIPTGVPHSGPIGGGPGGVGVPKPKHMTNDNANKHMNQSNPGMEEGLLDKFMTESVHRSIPGSHDPSKIMMPGSRLVEDHSKDHNGADSSSHKNPNLTIAPANNSPISSSEK